MNVTNLLAVFMVATCICGCTTSSEQVMTVPLLATQRNAGQIANTTLAGRGTQTGFSFIISGIPSGVSLPLRLYTFIYKGSCEQPGPIAFSLNDQVNTERAAVRGWTYSRSAPVAMSELLSGGYSIVVRTAPSDGNVDIFCGDITQ
ncbi:hypothetical protein PS726_00247 [Pseudomonas fluorescens]|uniref:hypothetical protein n=1 Tax=Pseudomonas fluorescens TaxID=294 RepID=UPI00124050CA|nr:hypothetical protein [Pseudomonas fluorescens]VVN68439.1 hypothetical protein PS726_00247 [Pseudomonas fluorescens]